MLIESFIDITNWDVCSEIAAKISRLAPEVVAGERSVVIYPKIAHTSVLPPPKSTMAVSKFGRKSSNIKKFGNNYKDHPI